MNAPTSANNQLNPYLMNEKAKKVLEMAYDRACEATSDLSAARHCDVSSTMRDRINYAYNLSHDLQRAIKGILYAEK